MHKTEKAVRDSKIETASLGHSLRNHHLLSWWPGSGTRAPTGKEIQPQDRTDIAHSGASQERRGAEP